MRKKNREINIFSMSALDLFASALGAFILITIILFPYYLKVDRKLLKENKELQAQLAECRTSQGSLQAELDTCQNNLTTCNTQNTQLTGQLDNCQNENRAVSGQLGQCQQDVEECTRGASECAKELKKIFLIAVMNWNTKDDIDLHVIDPNGKEYYYKKKTHPGSAYELSYDTVNGPGVEIWEAPNAQPGKYKVYYKYYAKKENKKPTVKGRLYFRNEVVKLNTKILSTKGAKTLVATVIINDEGEVSITKH